MNLETHIRQQQATVQMLEKLLKAKRCNQGEVDQSKQRLADLEQQTTFVPIACLSGRQVPRPERVVQPSACLSGRQAPDFVSTGRQIVGEEYTRIQAELSTQANTLNRQMAELSNQLHKIPSDVSCPQLTCQILS